MKDHCNHKENCKECLKEEIDSLKKKIVELENRPASIVYQHWPQSIPGNTYPISVSNFPAVYWDPISMQRNSYKIL